MVHHRRPQFHHYQMKQIDGPDWKLEALQQRYLDGVPSVTETAVIVLTAAFSLFVKACMLSFKRSCIFMCF